MLKRQMYEDSSPLKPGPFGLWDNKEGEGSVTIRSVLYNQKGEFLVVSCITKNDVAAMQATLGQGECLLIVSKFRMNDGFYHPAMTIDKLAETFDILITKDVIYSATDMSDAGDISFTSPRTGLVSKFVTRDNAFRLLKS